MAQPHTCHAVVDLSLQTLPDLRAIAERERVMCGGQHRRADGAEAERRQLLEMLHRHYNQKAKHRKLDEIFRIVGNYMPRLATRNGRLLVDGVPAPIGRDEEALLRGVQLADMIGQDDPGFRSLVANDAQFLRCIGMSVPPDEYAVPLSAAFGGPEDGSCKRQCCRRSGVQ